MRMLGSIRQRQSVTAAEFAKVLHWRRAQKETGNHLPSRLLNNSLAGAALRVSDTGVMAPASIRSVRAGPS
ncbi:hypothetical protein GCM10008942_40840 [Rhizomicrobium electricum]|uniref:Uncharacterized protein n=1 Tax=Rhizomicrobium electricum TaxID=480070 RepID=A0ABP3QBL9_9PROT